MSHSGEHPSQDILAGLQAPQGPAEIPVNLAREIAPQDLLAQVSLEAQAALAGDLLAQVSAEVSQDPLAQVEAQLNDPLFALEERAAAPERGLGERLWDNAKFVFNYACVSAIIFTVLLGTMNWRAYAALASAWISPAQLEQAHTSMSKAMADAAVSDAQAAPQLDASGAQVAAATVAAAPQAAQDVNKSAKRAAVLEERLKQEKVVLKRDWLTAKTFLRDAAELTYNVEITPYDNRVIIPKLGKNIPLVNVDNHKVGNAKDWNKIFEHELEKGIIKYPGSADPGETGNSFVFGHSSNFPWIKGDYNDVFALLDKLDYGDEVTVYFKQKKYVYVIREKHVIKPGYVNAMKGREEAKQLTLMTCWPIGTTLNRLIVMGDLKPEAPAAAGGVAGKDGSLVSMK